MTDFKLRRRTPARRLRYIATQLNDLKGASPKELAVLAAAVICINDLADELEPTGACPRCGCSCARECAACQRECVTGSATQASEPGSAS